MVEENVMLLVLGILLILLVLPVNYFVITLIESLQDTDAWLAGFQRQRWDFTQADTATPICHEVSEQ